MNFRNDLINIVKAHFLQEDISYKEVGDAEDFAAYYCEILNRRIANTPRHVHSSEELNVSLGKLTQESAVVEREKALEAWNTVFKVWHLLTSGGDLKPFLSRNTRDAASKDGLLWDYGMHHFHLGSGLDEDGFVTRSDYLLFAIVSDADAFLVDVRKHLDPEGLLWVRQDLLEIVHRNWPEITNSRLLHGVQGATLTDEQKKVLRRKNANTALDLNGAAIMPIGWGTNTDGSSLWCSVWADKLLWEIERQESYFNSQPEELGAALEAQGITTVERMDFRLVLLDSIDATPELVDHMLNEDHLGQSLCAMGFAVVEVTSGYPIMITDKGDSNHAGLQQEEA